MSHYRLDIPINTPDKAFDLFTAADDNYVRYLEGYGGRIEKPPDFELHLAVHILEREGLPLDILEPVKTWARENKTASPVPILQ